MTRYIACLVFLMLWICGCGSQVSENAIEKQIEKETGADANVDISDDGLNISGETEDGAFSLTSGEGVQLPDNFASDVFLYKPSELKVNIDTPNGQSLTFTTGDDVSEVIAAYKSEMPAKGWEEKASMNMGQQSMLIYEKGDRAAQITVGKSRDETQILLILGDN